MTVEFDFITDDELRSILVADYKEMRTCADSKAWKAVHVLAGSIIEAVIADYLIAEKHVSREKAMKMELSQSIDLAAQKGILSEKLRNLSVVVKDYRNLVHPGRSIRLDENPDNKNSSIATTLVEMICKELGDRKGSHGYTAEQVIGKIRRDFTAGAILQDLLRKDVSSKEIRRLLTKIIPETYYEEQKAANDFEYEEKNYRHVLPTLKSLYHLTYQQADTDLRRDVARSFIQIVKEADSDIINIHINTFWWMGQLEYLCNEDIQTIKRYLFSRIKQELSHELINILTDISKHLPSKDTPEWIVLLVHVRCHGGKEAAEAAYHILLIEDWEMDEEDKSILFSRLDFMQSFYREKERNYLAEIVEATKDLVEIPYPF